MKSLVVYFSKTGNTKKVALKIASELKADVEEIKNLTNNPLVVGFKMLFKGKTKIAKINKNIDDYDLVVVGGPIWSWALAMPVRTFLTDYYIKGKVAFFSTMGGNGDLRAYKEMSKITGKKPLSTLTVIDKKINECSVESFVKKLRS